MTDIITQYDEIGKDYVENQKAFFASHDDPARELMYGLFDNLEGKAILDVGCGGGTDMEIFLDKGASLVCGIDPSEYMVHVARKRIGEDHKIEVGGFENIPFADNSFDILTGRYSMHYLESFEKAYKEIYRVLKPQGYFVLVLPHPFRRNDHVEKNERGVEIIHVPLYEGKVIVKNPLHTFGQYFSDTFFELFTISNFREFASQEVSADKGPTAMVIKGYKK